MVSLGHCALAHSTTCKTLFLLHFQWLQDTFLEYLDRWETAVTEREGFTDSEKKAMLLSTETSTGLKLTGMTLYMYVIHICTFTCILDVHIM